MKLISKKIIILFSIFAAFFLISLVFIAADADRRVERVLFFPDESGDGTYGELRRLPLRNDLAGDIELYVNELILGPANIDFYRLFPESVKLESLLLDDQTLYLGFSENLIITAETVPLSFTGILEAVKTAVLFNFPEIEGVHAAVGGEPAE